MMFIGSDWVRIGSEGCSTGFHWVRMGSSGLESVRRVAHGFLLGLIGSEWVRVGLNGFE